MPEMIAGARALITLPTPSPLGGGVLSVANVIPTTGHALMGAEAETDACAEAHEWDEWCTTTPTDRKVFDALRDYVEGDPFAVYAGVSCDLQRLDDAKARAEKRLSYAESRIIDYHVDAQLSSNADVVDLGGPMAVDEAIALAEAFAATVYGGAPTLLIPRAFVQIAANEGGMVSHLDGTLTTFSGSRVAPLTTPITLPLPDPLTGTLYVTGSVTLLQGPVSSFSVPQQVADDGTFAPMRALAERIYVPVFDCLVAKVEVTRRSL